MKKLNHKRKKRNSRKLWLEKLKTINKRSIKIEQKKQNYQKSFSLLVLTFLILTFLWFILIFNLK